jgi:hypothetical protein
VSGFADDHVPAKGTVVQPMTNERSRPRRNASQPDAAYLQHRDSS